MPLFTWARLFRYGRPNRVGGVAVALLSDGVALAHFRPGDAAGGVNLLKTLHYPCAAADRRRVLADAITSLGLAGSDCRLVLAPGDFRMLQTARPEVPEDELREALRWRIQDMLDFPATEAAIEYFFMPSPRQAGSGRLLTVLACPGDLIRDYSEWCENAGLQLRVIDIPEMALRNLGALLPESARGVALLCLQRERGMLQLQQGDEIYISRELSLGARLFETDAPVSADAEAALERLALEVQRSLDYYESHYGQSPVSGLVVTPIAKGTQHLVDGLNRSLGVISRAMDLGALVDCERMDDRLQQACLPAVGEALRREAGA